MAISLQDREGIRDLIARYSQTIDFQDIEGLIDCFAPDGSFAASPQQENHAGSHVGHENLRDWAKQVFAACEGHVRHSSLNIVIEGDGDRAWASSYALITRDYGSAYGKGQLPHASIVSTGVYRDELIKRDGRWYFQTRAFRFDGFPEVLELVGKPFDVRATFA